jgi:hypothetical protein
LYGWPEHRGNVHRGDGHHAAKPAGKITPSEVVVEQGVLTLVANLDGYVLKVR